MWKSRIYISIYLNDTTSTSQRVFVFVVPCPNVCDWLERNMIHIFSPKWSQKCYNHQFSVVEKRLQFKSNNCGGVTANILYSKAMCHKPQRQQLTTKMYSCVSAQSFLQSMWGAIMKLNYIFKGRFNMKCKTVIWDQSVYFTVPKLFSQALSTSTYLFQI